MLGVLDGWVVCGHAFGNPNNKLGYREAAANDAWARTLAFLNRTLKAQ
jgi:dienelactone hydrolase